MPISLFDQNHFISSPWSGGSTTQLFIWPADASYAARNFELRISTAKVESEASVFTALPGYQRSLMLLEGEMHLTHQGHHQKHLQVLDVDHFSGNWHTTARGRCTDFNLMTRGSLRTELLGWQLEAGTHRLIHCQQLWEQMFIYLHKGAASLSHGTRRHSMQQGTLLHCTPTLPTEMSLFAQQDCLLALVWVGMF